jgi:hypothetical protein
LSASHFATFAGPTLRRFPTAAAICCLTHCLQNGNFFHHQFGALYGQPEVDSKQVKFDGQVLIRAFRGKPQRLSGRQ